jgi:uncharacterized membrane protein
MIANIVNVLIGLWVTYVAVFGIPASAPVPWILAPVGIGIAVLALIARRSDFSGWQSSTNIVLGLVLCIATLIDRMSSISTLVTFWTELWVGLTVASLALWAALYHPAEDADLPRQTRAL